MPRRSRCRSCNAAFLAATAFDSKPAPAQYEKAFGAVDKMRHDVSIKAKEIIASMHAEKAYTDTMTNQLNPYRLSRQLNELK